MNEVVIIEAVRTPVGRRGGLFKDFRPDEMAAEVLKELVKRAGIQPELIDDVIMGCVSQVGEQAADIGRVAALIAGFPTRVPGTTIDRQCGSSQQAVHFASQAILAGDMDCVIAAGVENMTRVPMFSSMQGTQWSEKLTSKYEMVHQGESAERIAEKWRLSRLDLDQFAYESHEKAVKAQEEGRFDREIMPLTNEAGTALQKDEGPRSGTSVDILQKLKPSFRENGIIHPGNSSPISDGAAALLLMSRKMAEELGLNPKFRILARAVIGTDPTLMLTGPIPATEMVLKKAGLSINDIDHFEINEAFAPVVLAWLKETGADREKVNPNGGAIALGHPLGASGARLMTTMIHELERTGGRFGLQAMCEGLGMANATIIERLD
jgi:acetyl-CoA acyltransferase